MHLGGTSTPSLFAGTGIATGTAATGSLDLFSDLRSPLNGSTAQTGFNQLLATQLLGLD